MAFTVDATRLGVILHRRTVYPCALHVSTRRVLAKLENTLHRAFSTKRCYSVTSYPRFGKQKLGKRRISASSNFSTDTSRKDDEYCVDLVRKCDFENYLLGLLYPKHCRKGYFAIRAFNVELATTKENVHFNQMTGNIRLQWWKEALDKIYNGQGQSHPVIKALSRAISEHQLTRRWLERLIDERLQDFDSEKVGTLQEVEHYAENTAASLLYLSLELVGVEDEATDVAASYIGRAAGLTTFLRAMPYVCGRGHLCLPSDIQEKHKISFQDMQAAAKDPAEGVRLSDAVFDIAVVANAYVEDARSKGKEVAKEALPILRAGVGPHLYLQALEKCNFNAFDPSLVGGSHLKYQMALLKHQAMRSY